MLCPTGSALLQKPARDYDARPVFRQGSIGWASATKSRLTACRIDRNQDAAFDGAE
jgi:hypothetical protein